MADKDFSINTKAEAIRRFFEDCKAENHPIKDHPISQAEEYVRDLYLDMLCVVAQYECSDTENSFKMIRRIMAACNEPQPLSKYIKYSMEINLERAAEFIKQCKDNELCEIFMIDSMLLSCSNGLPNAKQAAFIAQFGDMLEFDKDKIFDAAKFALAILEQDSDKYQEILNDDNEAFQINALCYAREFVSGSIICTSKKKHFYSKKLTQFNVPLEEGKNVWTLSTLDEVKFENLIISNMEYLDLETIKNVTFEGCRCMRGPLKLASIDKVTINNCDFKWEGADYEYENNYIQNRAIEAYLDNCRFVVTNTSFSGYKVRRYTSYYYTSEYYYTGAVIYGKCSCLFDNCDFSDIRTEIYNEYGWTKFGQYTIYYSSNGKAEITNCHFSNCQCNGKLFYNVSSESGNVLVNSSPIK